MLERLARFGYRRRWLMLLLWIVALVGTSVLSSALGGEYSNEFSLPGTESQEALDLLRGESSQFAWDTALIVFEADQGVNDPSVRARTEELFASIAKVEHVVGIESPYTDGGGQVSPDGRIAFATVRFEDLDGEPVPIEIADQIKELSARAATGGLTIEPGGTVIQFSEFEQPGGTEMIGLLAAMFILLIAFGSVLAMGLPILTALFGIGIGLSLVLLFATILNVPDFTPQLASMIGIGVGIDYALFIVTRYRTVLHQDRTPEEATVVAITTSGKAVLFAGTTVVISLLGILLMGFPAMEGVAVGGASTVAITMLASVTLLPAILGFTGHRIDRWRLRWFHRAQEGHERSMWIRWSRTIQRHPASAALIGLAVLIALALPVFSITLGFADAGTAPATRSSKRAYDLLSKGFGPGFNGPLLLAARADDPGDLQTLERVREAIASTDGIAAVTPPFTPPGGSVAVLTAYPTTSPQDPDTTTLVKRLRREVIPAATAGSSVRVLVGGLTAALVDVSDVTADRLPILIGVVIALSFLLLVFVFRSILVPLKAAVMNLLSIAAAYGAIVAVFQWGWLADVFAGGTTGPIEAWVPMMLFTILFGLSMDYEIFLLSRIQEEYARTGDNASAVANGLASTARVITAAAAIMVALFLSFVFGFEERAIKLFGMGLAVAIFVDATIVRMVLVPATMELLGNANWWLPRWLRRVLPEFHVEGKVLLDEPVPTHPAS